MRQTRWSPKPQRQVRLLGPPFPEQPAKRLHSLLSADFCRRSAMMDDPHGSAPSRSFWVPPVTSRLLGDGAPTRVLKSPLGGRPGCAACSEMVRACAPRATPAGQRWIPAGGRAVAGSSVPRLAALPVDGDRLHVVGKRVLDILRPDRLPTPLAREGLCHNRSMAGRRYGKPSPLTRAEPAPDGWCCLPHVPHLWSERARCRTS